MDTFPARFVGLEVALVLPELVAVASRAVDVSIGGLHLLLDFGFYRAEGSTVLIMLVADKFAAARVTIVHHVEAELLVSVLTVRCAPLKSRGRLLSSFGQWRSDGRRSHLNF